MLKKMPNIVSVFEILEENELINKENQLLHLKINQLVKENAILETENQMLKRYKELYSLYVLWKEQ